MRGICQYLYYFFAIPLIYIPQEEYYEEKMKKGNFSDYFNSPDSLLLAGVPLCKVWELGGRFQGEFSHGKVLMHAFQFGN